VTGAPSVERWRALRPGTRRVLAVAAAILGVNAALAGLESVTGGAEPGGPASSSYATAPDGMAAFAQLLTDRGHPVRRLRAGLADVDLDPAATLVVAGSFAVTPPEGEAVARFVEAGGRLVVAADDPSPLLRRLAGTDGWSAEPVRRATVLVPVPEVEGVSTVTTGGSGSWSDAGASLPVLAAGDATLATVAAAGRGRVVAVADPSVWHNRLLDEADNAAFGLAAVGERGRPVEFAEAHHGYGRSRGLGVVPWRWRWAAGVALVAAALGMWSRGRRFGPPEDAERQLPPPRRAYVDAVAASLVRTRRPAESLAPLQEAARRRIVARAGLPADAGPDDVRGAAAGLGLDPEDVDAVLRPAATDGDVLAAGRALARIETGAR
jgi:hypothetical protein